MKVVMSTKPIQSTITKIRNYPDKLVIFKHEESRYWQARYYTSGRTIKKSLRTTDKIEAKKRCIEFYQDIIFRERELLPLQQSTLFSRVTQEVIYEIQIEIDRGNLHQKTLNSVNSILNKYMSPYFAKYDVKSITYSHINNYINTVKEKSPDLSNASFKKHFQVLRRIFTYCERENLIEKIPTFPTIKDQSIARGFFNKKEYNQFKKEIVTQTKLGAKIRGNSIDRQFGLLVTFMTNTFLRPSDIKNLKHRNIEIIDYDEEKFLEITTDSSKTKNTPVISMRDAVDIYEDICKLNDNFCKPDDYVFYPQFEVRDSASKLMSDIFNHVAESCDLKTTKNGQNRTLYSFRHTAIMFRLLYGDKVDLLTLAKNCRTSVEMIEKFYASHLQPRMNADIIQSFRK